MEKELWGEQDPRVCKSYLLLALELISLGEIETASNYINAAEKYLINDKTGIADFLLPYTKATLCFVKDDVASVKNILDQIPNMEDDYAKPSIMHLINSLGIAELYSAIDEYEKALSILDEVIAIHDLIDDNFIYLIHCYITKADIFLEQRNIDSFLEEYNRALNIWNNMASTIVSTSPFVRLIVVDAIALVLKAAKLSYQCGNRSDFLSWINTACEWQKSLNYTYDAAKRIFGAWASLMININQIPIASQLYGQLLELQMNLLGADHLDTISTKQLIDELTNIKPQDFPDEQSTSD